MPDRSLFGSATSGWRQKFAPDPFKILPRDRILSRHGCGGGQATLGKPLGVEITAPQAVSLDRLNQVLAELGEPPLAEQDYNPARAA